MDSITTSLPIYLEMGVNKKTSFSLNLNTYRNAHYQILNKAKVLFQETVAKRIGNYPAMKRVRLDYALFFGSKRAVDVANVCCIVDKFFCDTLVNCGKVPDDDWRIISNVAYAWGGIDTQNPRVEVTLSEIELSVEEPEPPMQISFTQDEIRDALLEALEKQVVLQPGQTTRIAFDLEDPKDIIAYVDIIRGDAKATGKQNALTPKQVETLKADAAQSTGRGRGKAAQAAPAATPAPTVEKAPSEAPTPVAEPEKVDPPFDVDTKTETPATEAAPEVAPETTAEPEVETKAEAIKTGNSIFPTAGSSAAPNPAPAVPAGKSLFANLTRPGASALN